MAAVRPCLKSVLLIADTGFAESAGMRLNCRRIVDDHSVKILIDHRYGFRLRCRGKSCGWFFGNVSSEIDTVDKIRVAAAARELCLQPGVVAIANQSDRREARRACPRFQY